MGFALGKGDKSRLQTLRFELPTQLYTVHIVSPLSSYTEYYCHHFWTLTSTINSGCNPKLYPDTIPSDVDDLECLK